MGTHIDEMVLALLKALAICVIVSGVLAVPAELMKTPMPSTYLPMAALVVDTHTV